MFGDFSPIIEGPLASDAGSSGTTPWWVPLVQSGVMTAEQVIDTQVIPPPTMNFPPPVYGTSYLPSSFSSITSSPLFWPAVLFGAFLLLRRK
jgi:hypothetical protein